MRLRTGVARGAFALRDGDGVVASGIATWLGSVAWLIWSEIRIFFLVPTFSGLSDLVVLVWLCWGRVPHHGCRG